MVDYLCRVPPFRILFNPVHTPDPGFHEPAGTATALGSYCSLHWERKTMQEYCNDWVSVDYLICYRMLIIYMSKLVDWQPRYAFINIFLFVILTQTVRIILTITLNFLSFNFFLPGIFFGTTLWIKVEMGFWTCKC